MDGPPLGPQAFRGPLGNCGIASDEPLVLDGVRKHLASFDKAERAVAIDDRDLIERCLDRIVAKPKAIENRLLLRDADRVSPDGTDQCREDGDRIDHSLSISTTTIISAN
jgi:hypothetical protein